jgi:hypothetical protein
MPAVGFMCEKKGPVEFDDCLACASTWSQPCDFTYPMLKQMVDGIRRERKKVTITNLTGCLRKEILSRRLEYYVAPSEEFWRFRGTLTHEIMSALKAEAYDIEKVVDEGDRSVLVLKGDDLMIEQRLGMVFVHEGEEYPVSGQMDLVVKSKKKLVDYKTAKAVPRYKNPYSNHTTQVNLYRRLCTENDIPIESLEIVYMDMMQPKRLEAQIWPDKKIDRFFVDRLVPLWKAIRTETIPAKPDNDNDGLWMCENYCNEVMKNECKALARTELEAEVLKKKCVQCKYRIQATQKPGVERERTVAEQVIDEQDYVGDLPGQGE